MTIESIKLQTESRELESYNMTDLFWREEIGNSNCQITPHYPAFKQASFHIWNNQMTSMYEEMLK